METLVERVRSNEAIETENEVLTAYEIMREYTESKGYNCSIDWPNFDKWNNWPNH
jgi:hypothetical protein